MNEQAVFEAALEIENVAKREAFIEKACAGNAELRERVESLLKSHASAGSFLEVPVVQPLKADPNRPVDRTSDFTANTGTVELSEKEEDLAAVLELLQPSSKPGSLGVLGHYEVLQLLGQGGFGIVFKAFDEKLHRLVAIKVMNPQMAATSPPRKRFLREARAAAAVKHENIVQVHSVEEQPLPYLVMEYVEGPTLAQKLDGSGPLETTEVLHVARQIASGLAAAHEKGRIHRDIKPGNILVELGAVQKIKITDFGLARAVDDASLTRTGMIAGTPMYMAPEQALGQTLDHRADLFSLGSVMYQMACGRPPFRASTTIAVLRRVADDTPRPLQEILSEIPDWLVAIVNKLHAKNPEDRFQSAKEVADLLGRCQTELQLNGNVTEVEGIDKPANPKVEAAPAEKAAPSDGPILFFFKSVIAGASLMAMFLMAWSLYTALTSSTEKTWLTATQKPSQAQTHVAQEPDRALAEWVISLGGTVQIDNQANEIVLLNDLPKKAFYVSGINLDASPWITDSDTALFAKAKRLRRLYLANTRLTDDFAAPLAKCENLEELFVHGTQVSRKTFAVCKNLKKLRTFFASGSVDAAVSQLQDCSELDYLSLSISDLSDDGLAHLRNLKNLKTLEVKITPITDAGLENLKELRNLHFLDLKETAVTQAGVNRLREQLPTCKIEWNGGVIEPKFPSEAAKSLIGGLLKAGVIVENDRYLKLATIDELIAGDRIAILRINEKAAADPELLALLGRLPDELWRKEVDSRAIVFSGPIPADRLQEILALPAIHSVAGLTFMTGDSPLPDTAFTDLIRFKELAHLFLPPNSVSDEAFKTMIAAMPKLSVLGLSGTKITDAGLANLRGRPIRKLELQSCPQIDDAAADHLAAIPTLESLLLNGTSITDAGLEKLTTLSKLTTLNVDGTKVTADGVKKLATAIPRCQIVWGGKVIEPSLK